MYSVKSALLSNQSRLLNLISRVSVADSHNRSGNDVVDDHTIPYSDSSDPVSYETLYYFILVNMWGPGLGVCIFGVFTNIINIITFLKQGVKDTVNISLLGLATSDLASLLAMSFPNIVSIPAFSYLSLPFVADDFLYLFVWLHVMFTRVTTLITAYITLERCLCVAAPLRVKNMFTPAKTVVCIISIYVVMLASISPMLYTARFTWIFDTTKNTTSLRVTFMDNRNWIENITFASSNLIPTAGFFLVIICTALLVFNLQRKSKWRRESSSSANTSAISSRDRKVVKMVTLISVIFSACYFPGTAGFIWMILDTEMRFDGKHRNQLYAVYSVLFNMESINASINLFVYLRLSSKFRTTFLDTFCFHRQKTNSKR